MLMSARDLVLRAPAADEHAIRVAMSGNLCRCTGYVGIVRAVQSVIAARRARGIAPVNGAGRTALGPAGSGHGLAVAPKGAVAAGPRASREAADTAAAADRIASWEPQASFDQSFAIRRPLDEVWRFFEDTAKVASCLPGTSLSGDATGREVAGKMRVKVGPISAEFHGTAEIDRDAATHSGTIQGSGRDRRSASATRGLIRYRLRPDGEATKVELNVGYRLTGPLAQFSRSDLVHDIASRLIGVFAQNVEAQLAGTQQRAPAAEFNAGGLFVSVLAGRVRALLRRLFGTNS
jgi:carbon-monoxide dehydrogenase small subunit